MASPSFSTTNSLNGPHKQVANTSAAIGGRQTLAIARSECGVEWSMKVVSPKPEPMRRKGRSTRGENVTLDEVVEVAKRMEANGEEPNECSVRIALGPPRGRGSMTTVNRFLNRYLNGEQSASAAVKESPLSPEVTRVLAAEIGRQVKERTVTLKAGRDEVQILLSVAMNEKEALRAALGDAELRLGSMQALLSEQIGTANAYRAQAEALASRLAVEHAEAEGARQQSAVLRSELRTSEERRSIVEEERVGLKWAIELGRRELEQVKEAL